MTCLSCYYSNWNGVANDCGLHVDYDIVAQCFRECKDFVYEPGTDEMYTLGYELNRITEDADIEGIKIEISYNEDSI